MAVDNQLLLILKSAGLGGGEPDLGEKLMEAFLNNLFESGKIPGKIIFMNTGIFLTTQGSSFIEIVKKYEEEGSEILTCGTCLNYYDRQDRLLVGKPTNMKDTVNAMLNLKKVLIP